ncbi:flagellar protein FliT [Pelagirhabdus alkalitolerans]|uniref:Flagellar protein FliT n=1 Tax=Pelagirhabdus alkalitolerans TaxID=1612202 RepID=A0A1G6MRY4_9BACI|nr:hypothetical protein [Pelagirhabdus alkalitolerans]SDC58348.1 flagellar protein FliT [Pelagirhabdus alkalitolerans]
MRPLDQLKTITDSLENLVNKPVSSKDRDIVIEQIQDKLTQRQKVIDQLKTPQTDDDKKLGQDILKKDRVIQEKVQELLLDVKKDMNKHKKHKNTSTKYLNPYQHVSVKDGSYWDKKK